MDSIEMFSHSTRKHSYLGYRSPNDSGALRKVAELCVHFPLTTTCRATLRYRDSNHNDGEPVGARDGQVQQKRYGEEQDSCVHGGQVVEFSDRWDSLAPKAEQDCRACLA